MCLTVDFRRPSQKDGDSGLRTKLTAGQRQKWRWRPVVFKAKTNDLISSRKHTRCCAQQIRHRKRRVGNDQRTRANHFGLSEKIRLVLRDPNLVVQAFETDYARKSGLLEAFHFF
jgi:hypothetical protein